MQTTLGDEFTVSRPVREQSQCRTHKSASEQRTGPHHSQIHRGKTAWVKPGKFLCVKTMSRQLEVREGEQLQGGREIAVRGCLANSWSQEKCLRETKTAKSLCVRRNRQNRGESGISCVSEVHRGGVCMWVRTDSPATPIPRQ